MTTTFIVTIVTSFKDNNSYVGHVSFGFKTINNALAFVSSKLDTYKSHDELTYNGLLKNHVYEYEVNGYSVIHKDHITIQKVTM